MISKFQRIDLVIYSYSREGKPNSRINMVLLNMPFICSIDTVLSCFKSAKLIRRKELMLMKQDIDENIVLEKKICITRYLW